MHGVVAPVLVLSTTDPQIREARHAAQDGATHPGTDPALAGTGGDHLGTEALQGERKERVRGWGCMGRRQGGDLSAYNVDRDNGLEGRWGGRAHPRHLLGGRMIRHR